MENSNIREHENKGYRIFLLIIVIGAVIKQIMVMNIPIYVIANATFDDRLMIEMATALQNGQWLGEYSNHTLVKGIMFPLFLAINHKFGIPYTTAITLFYTIACVVFVIGIRPIFQKYKSLSFIYLVLLLNPLTYAVSTFQRVYRNALTMGQVLLVVGCFAGLYFRRNDKTPAMVFWGVASGLSFAFFWNTREDSIWLLPFACGVVFVGAIERLIRKSNKLKTREKIKQVFIYCIPFVILFGVQTIISCINAHQYGVYTTNELNNSYFPDVVKTIYSIDNKEEKTNISVTRAKMRKLYSVSKTLKKYEPFIEQSLDLWALSKQSSDQEVADGWFFWALRDGIAYGGGYKSAESVNKEYQAINQELQEAITKGELDTQPVMPSALMSPWRAEYKKELMYQYKEAIFYVTSFKGIQTSMIESIDDGEYGIELFEAMTNNRAVYPIQEYRIKGWYVNYDQKVSKLLLVDRQSQVLKEIPMTKSRDIYQFYLQEGKDYESAKQARFDCIIPNNSFDNQTTIRAYDTAGKEVGQFVLTHEEVDCERDNQRLVVDQISDKEERYRENVSIYVNRLNRVTKVYQKTAKVVFFVGIVCYMILSCLLWSKRQREENHLLDTWFLLSGILASFLILLFGVVYTHISAYPAIDYFYLSGAYSLWIAFWTIGIAKLLDGMKLVKINRKGGVKVE